MTQTKAPPDAYQRQLQHLIKLAKQQGWKAYAWHQAKELDKQPLFAGIAADLTTAMRETSK